MYYVSKNYLGNITLLTRRDGTVAEDYSYDAWGRRHFWHSDVWVGSAPNYQADTRSVDHTSYKINITNQQKQKLLQSIKASALNPPKYRFLGTRCSGWAVSMLRQAHIIGPYSKLYDWPPLPTRNYLELYAD